MRYGKDRESRNDAELGEQAAQWLLRFEVTDRDAQDGCADEKSRNEAFYEWVATSPHHMRVFLEMLEVHRRMQLLDAQRAVEVETLLRHRADVIPLCKDKSAPPMQRADEWLGEEPALPPRRALVGGGKRMRVTWPALAAAVLIAVGAMGGYWLMREQYVYTTRVGEQRSAKLEDGSFIYLNTDSKVEVAFSAGARNVRLIRGEALFVVEHDPSRPFTVTAGDAAVRALGTQFNVRRRARGADVAVVEGTVQVTALDERAGFPVEKLVAGEEAQVLKGKIAPGNRQVVAEALAWRQRRLIFHDAPLAEVAAEFNRYNRTKIRIEGEAAEQIMLSGIFDADRPQALMLYVARRSDFAVEPQGNDWVIRGR